MNVITAIEPQKKREDRRSIFVDGEFVAGVHTDVVHSLSLSVGQSLDRGRLIELLKAETARSARESALRLIAYRSRTCSEVRKRLIGSEFPEDIVEEVVDSLAGLGLLDDEKFSRDWVRSRSAAKPMGRMRLEWELRSRGVEPAVVEETLEEMDEDAEFRLALEAARKKTCKSVAVDAAGAKTLSSFLRRRGFGWDVISRVLSELHPQDTDAH